MSLKESVAELQQAILDELMAIREERDRAQRTLDRVAFELIGLPGADVVEQAHLLGRRVARLEARG